MELAYDDVGGGPCVVLIHGHPFDRSLWQSQAAALARDFRVVAPDLRGFGERPVTPHSVSMREYAEDVARGRALRRPEYDLAGSIWTADAERGAAIARRIPTGTYGVNTFTVEPAVPFGALGRSGLGREGWRMPATSSRPPRTVRRPSRRLRPAEHERRLATGGCAPVLELDA